MDATPYRFRPAPQPYQRLGLWCVGLLVVASLAALWLWRLPGVQLLSVQSGSMAPTIHKGDAVVVEPATIADIHVGDVVSYRSPTDTRIIITHRVQAISQRTGLVVTKGDNTAIADQPFNNELIVGRVQQRVAKAGYLVDALRSTTGLIAAIYIPAAIVIALEFRRLTGYFRPAYRLYARAR